MSRSRGTKENGGGRINQGKKDTVSECLKKPERDSIHQMKQEKG